MSLMKTIAVVDLHPIVREGVRALAATATELEFAGDAGSLPQALDIVTQLEPSVLLVDEGFGSNSVLAFLADLKKAGRRTAAVVWGASLTQAKAVQYLKAGAVGTARKSISPPELLTGLNAAAAGERWISESLGLIEPDAVLSRANLTRREREVLDNLIEGRTNREIADELNIQPGTLKVHLRKIFHKTGIHTRHGLCLAAEPPARSANAHSTC